MVLATSPHMEPTAPSSKYLVYLYVLLKNLPAVLHMLRYATGSDQSVSVVGRTMTAPLPSVV